MVKLFEAVPNISEGRDQQKIASLVSILQGIKGLKVLDYSSDVDHHRSVITYIGTAEAIANASFLLVEKANQILDLTQHKGVHPRFGVVDVLPIIPIWQTEMSEAVDLAHSLGQEIEARLSLPVHFYEFAAKEPKNRNLAVLRRELYNSSEVNAPGVVCLSARNFLVAYNFNLDTQDLDKGRRIAVQLREKNSGLIGVKALAFYLDSKDQVQISLNLTVPEKAGPDQVRNYLIKLLKAEACAIESEELIGVMPEQVLREAEKFSNELEGTNDN